MPHAWTSRRRRESGVSKMKSLPVDYDEVEKESARVKRRFNEIFQ